MAHLNAFLGRFFDWHGYATRRHMLALVGVWILFVFISLTPFIWYTTEYINNTIDFGPEAADIMGGDRIEEHGGLLLFWVWCSSVLFTGLLVGSCMTTVRRLNHIGRSAWIGLLGFVPVLNLLFLAFLLIMPGRDIPKEN